jgi:polyisoprenoid-binding protein YceI
MRKLLFAFGLTSALVFALAAHAAAPNFAGTWTLDKSKSQGLSQRVQNA